MNTPILNRHYLHPTDGWYHIEPKGEHPNAAAGVVQVIDDDACRSIVQRFNQDADAGRLSHGQEMLIDHEHFRHDRDKESIAYGWLQRLEARNDGIYGKIRWSATGQNAVDGGDYRFFSTEYAPADLQPVAAPHQPPAKNQESSHVRPLRLDGLTLTNDPNNKGARPITNRLRSMIESSAGSHGPAGGDGREILEPGAHASREQPPLAGGRGATPFADRCPDEVRPAAAAVNQPQNHQHSKHMKNIATKLGLAAEASEEAILAEVTRLQNRITALEPLGTENTALKNRLTELDAANVDALLAGHGVKEAKVLNRMKSILLGTLAADRQACLDELLPQAKPGPTGATAAASQTKLQNRDTRPPAAGRQPIGDAPAADHARAVKIINRARELKKETPNLSDATAVLLAQRELEATE